MAVLLMLGVVSAVIVLYVGERLLKARARIRRRQAMGERLDAAARRAERQQEKRQAVATASEALTSYLPAINQPPLSVPGTDRPQPGREHAGPQRRLHLGRRGARSGEHPVRPRTGPHAAFPTRRHRPDAPDANTAGANADAGADGQ